MKQDLKSKYERLRREMIILQASNRVLNETLKIMRGRFGNRIRELDEDLAEEFENFEHPGVTMFRCHQTTEA